MGRLLADPPALPELEDAPPEPDADPPSPPLWLEEPRARWAANNCEFERDLAVAPPPPLCCWDGAVGAFHFPFACHELRDPLLAEDRGEEAAELRMVLSSEMARDDVLDRIVEPREMLRPRDAVEPPEKLPRGEPGGVPGGVRGGVLRGVRGPPCAPVPLGPGLGGPAAHEDSAVNPMARKTANNWASQRVQAS